MLFRFKTFCFVLLQFCFSFASVLLRNEIRGHPTLSRHEGGTVAQRRRGRENQRCKRKSEVCKNADAMGDDAKLGLREIFIGKHVQRRKTQRHFKNAHKCEMRKHFRDARLALAIQLIILTVYTTHYAQGVPFFASYFFRFVRETQQILLLPFALFRFNFSLRFALLFQFLSVPLPGTTKLLVDTVTSLLLVCQKNSGSGQFFCTPKHQLIKNKYAA